MNRQIGILFGITLGCFFVPTSAHAETIHAYVGTYTRGASEGIYHTIFDTETGKLSAPNLVAKVTNPSFLAIHPGGKYLYAVSETGDQQENGKPSGAIHAYQIDADTGKLDELNSALSGGAAPCHVNVDATGNFLLVANYNGGNATVTKIETDGSLAQRTALVQHSGNSVNQRRQKEPHAHSINLDPKNRFAVVADLGIDRLKIYRFDAASGEMTANGETVVLPGSGPRHFCFHPSGSYGYVINELSLTITVLSFDQNTGAMKSLQRVSTLPPNTPDKKGMSTAEIVVHPSGKFLYGSNRGHDSISVFSVDSKTGKLTMVQNQSTLGKTPRNFVVDPSGRYLLAENQGSDSITTFAIDQDSGTLQPTGDSVQVGSPVCIRFLVTEK